MPFGREQVLQTLRGRFASAQGIVAAMPSDRFVILHRLRTSEDVVKKGFEAVQEVQRRHRVTVHRNTLIYRLNTIARLTGRPTRDYRGALALYPACRADQLGEAGEET